MKILILTFFFICFFIGNSCAETWEKTYGGNQDDSAFSVQQTSDGGYIIAGRTSSFGAGFYDAYLIKTDSNGKEMWSKTFGGSNYDSAHSVQQTTDGGYIIVGTTTSFGAGSNDVYLIKTNAQGNELWSKTFGGNGVDSAWSVQQTNDGGYIIAGYSLGVYLIKTDANGNELWSNTNLEPVFGWSVQQTNDGGYIITGGSNDVCLIKTDDNGNKLWTKTFGGNAVDFGWSVQQTNDGGYIITGITGSFGAGSDDVYLIKTDANGNELWSQTYGGAGFDEAISVQQTTDGGYIMAGSTEVAGAIRGDAYLIKTDRDGYKLWSKTFGVGSWDWARSVQQTIDGGYIIAGGGAADVYLIYYKPDTLPTIVADFSTTPTSGPPPLTVNFTDNSIGKITSWSWNFGDGSKSTVRNPTHIYENYGTYTVSLTVTGREGSDTETKTDFINVRETKAMPWIPLLLLDEALK